MDQAPLTLSEALKSDRLEQFICEREAEETGPASKSDFDKLAELVIKSEKSEDRT